MKRLTIIFSGLVLISSLLSCNQEIKPSQTETENDTIYDSILPVYRYGLPIDSFIVEDEFVLKNQNLSSILSAAGVDYSRIHKCATEFDSVFDVRQFRYGQRYSLFFSPDTLKDLKYFIYEHNAIDFVVFDFTDSVSVRRDKKEVLLQQKTGFGSIKSSLWNAIMDGGHSNMLAIALEDIYGWSIDFFGLQQGDSFCVVYDEEYVDSTSVGVSQIHVASFTHYDSVYYAFPFVQDSSLSYFDIEGNSLKKAFLKAPLKFSRISSGFSNSRYHPILKTRTPHHGVDYAAPVGTPVVSIGDGKVVSAGWSGGAGKMVKIKHNSMYSTIYMHLSKFGAGIKEGAFVKQGQIIGYVGSTGLSTGPHLDFRVYKNGSPINPVKMESPPVEPVRPENMARFIETRDSLLNSLLQIKTDTLYETSADSL